ncbi:MAG: phage minor head protein [Pseudomonadota bacterium]
MTVELIPLAPADAIAALERRGRQLAPSFDWRDVYAQEHAAMFTVAKSAGFDVLADIETALERALSEGETFEQFARRLEPILREKGWWGRQSATDPETGQTRTVQLGSPRRLRTIFETNMRVSYATGHWERFQRQKQSRPFLRYVAILDEATRPVHRQMHNLVLPVDHPFWELFAPPNGWGCRCTLQNLSARDLDRLKAQGVAIIETPPDITTRPFTNRRTGEVRMIPDGIDPGWDYNPGEAGHARTVSRLEDKLDDQA